ncbi:ribonuclease E/G [Moraxella nasovis]|uniref:ribonuclease E/G n=1 Tax=Moraxella nasovis TaxID=2904121 RepID=UPI001F623FD5|nr:ribonuclease E/G [Moraxella nasovis]UNU73912.1 ribonuclease E/G [Moraxella nasovis]
MTDRHVLLIHQSDEYIWQAASLKHGQLTNFSVLGDTLVGSIFLGKVVRILPQLNCAFVDIGRDLMAFLPADQLMMINGKKCLSTLYTGELILVEVIKDEIGDKGATISTDIGFDGQYIRWLPKSSAKHHISKRLDRSAKAMAEQVLDTIKMTGSVIIRTNFALLKPQSFNEIYAIIYSQLEYLMQIYHDVITAYKTTKKPMLLYQQALASQLVNDAIFEVSDLPDVILADNQAICVQLQSLPIKVSYCAAAFADFAVIDKLTRALNRKVVLPSGGYLLIDECEAMTVIDVNSGSFVGKAGVNVAHQTNLEAIAVIATQLKLRGLGGIIIIDFIDIKDAAMRKSVLKSLKNTLKKDSFISYVSDFSRLGLIEIARRRTSYRLTSSMINLN